MRFRRRKPQRCEVCDWTVAELREVVNGNVHDLTVTVAEAREKQREAHEQSVANTRQAAKQAAEQRRWFQARDEAGQKAASARADRAQSRREATAMVVNGGFDPTREKLAIRQARIEAMRRFEKKNPPPDGISPAALTRKEIGIA